MMMLTVLQRGVGFARTAIFCSFLSEQELGQWSLVFSFVMFTAPMTLMGITGSFGRYVEHYYQQGQVKQFFKRTATVVACLVIAVLLGIWLAQDWVSWCLFGSTENRVLLVPACLTLVTTIIYNYFLEVVIALRRVRVGSLMELISSWTFAAVAVLSLVFTKLGSTGVIVGFAVGNICGAAYAASVVFRGWHKLPDSSTPFPHLSLWQKLAPFALGLWVTNLFTNTFDMVDRYMIIHLSGEMADQAQGMVGQYFSSMAIPLLMVGVSTTLSHLVMPYLSEDWEQGRLQAVSDRVNLSIKMLGTMLFFGSTCIMILAPFLFATVFRGKYDAGLSVLPYAIAFCYWRGLAVMVYNYLFCVERPRLMCVSLATGLIANIIFNALLLPILGLKGAALATAIGSVINICMVLAFCVRFGYRMDRGIVAYVVFPLVLPFGALATTVAAAVLLIISLRGNWTFSQQERADLEEILQGFLSKLTLRARTESHEQATSV